ncbi:19192_t:CDS:2 [Entrophospora sp. SA101]|nr:12700_t:CDS:2 [Entrophospora sp. SA101]CAJ0748937.1 19192_t:CDS:2 [Entrophospora sp. SA101]CAJ0869103.1 11259_t:CDS:2 [Entrophospora sp. SA101]CAJ0914565.1 1299_t:CDS:2 [Entrophospora sp. SA101]
MPELPEVETVLRALRASGVVGSPISQIEIRKEFHIKEITPSNFANNLLGQPLDTFRSRSPYQEIGPDLIQEEISVEYLLSRFQKLRIPIKSALLEQKIMSGIGNIYASEILFFCKISPLKPTNKITRAEIENIIYHSKKILQKSIELGGTSVVDFVSPLRGKGFYQNELKVYMKENKPCYECQTPIIMERINNRSSFFCPQCQKLGL